MTKATAKLKNLDVAPRKVRLVAGLLQGLPAANALAELKMNPRRASTPLMKLVQSAIANAKEKKMDPAKLVVASVRVDEGKALKRLLPQGRGRASIIKKRFSHVMIELVEFEGAKPKGFIMPKRVKKTKEPRAKKETRKPAFEEEAGKPKEKKGFMQKVFSRKAV